MNNGKAANRQFFRLEGLELPAEYKIVEEVFDIASVQFAETQVRDISAGGMSFISNNPVELDSEVQIKLLLDGEILHLLGQAVRCQGVVEDQDKAYEVAIKFIAIDGVEQDKIVGFIFQKQLEQRRRGLR